MQASLALQCFLLSLSGVKSPATSDWYTRRLSDLARFLGDVDVATVTVDDLRRWRAGLASRELSAFTLHGYVRAARRWFAWLVEEGHLMANPGRRLELPRLPRGVVRGISQRDLEKMLAAAAESGPRELALCWFLYSTACRVGGVVGLRLCDLDLVRARARVCEKGSKTRLVFMVPQAVEAMVQWLAARDSQSEYVFVGRRGRLTVSGVYQILKRLARVAGCSDRGWNPHSWRHRRLRELQAAGMPLGLVSQIAGHASVEVTAGIYGWLAAEELQRLYLQYALPINGANGTVGAK